jgi:heme exporter protein D
MSFNTWTEFWAMGGYGYFVWMSLGATFLAMVVETAVVRARHRAQKLRLRQRNELARLEEPQT